ncbi:MAG: iron-containing alcohol dehydrogenase [Hyphomicrobium sp.]|uniref:iron-containing alcohol dehydrogenase n=1 Tax=Hyphomicrobium sp. TaxID=82 RepID=UPI0039E36E03
MKIANANWSYPTKIWFGAGRISELPVACKEAGISRPLFVTDPGISKLPMVQSAVDDLARAGLQTSVFDALQGNPTSVNLADGIAAYRQGGHDGVVAFGGGSALDVGKTVALMVGQTRPVWDFEDIGDNWRRAAAEAIAPIIAVPTTAGTGSEVGRATVITDADHHVKKIIFHPAMMPKIAILDPELTVGLSPALTAGTGMDALSHAIEAFCAPSYHPMADAIAIESVRLVKDYLPRAVRTGDDIEARGQMLSAAAMAATAFQKGLGAIHSVSHPIGALYGTHHGLTNAVAMPYVIAFNAPAIGEKMQRLATYLGLGGGKSLSQVAAVQAINDWILELRSEIAIPPTIAELGVGADRLTEIARLAIVDPTAGTNPVPLTQNNVEELLAEMHAGTIRKIA